MSHPEREIFRRLGERGLTRVLHDVLDQTRLVRLANTCGLRYPGMRTRSQKRERILRDLVDRASREETTRRAVYRALQKETASATRTWSRLTEDEKLGRLEDADLAANGQLGLHLYLLAKDRSVEQLEQGLDRLLRRSDVPPAPAGETDATAEAARLRRQTTRLEKKVVDLGKKLAHLESQLVKAREATKTAKRDLIQRKGELAESRLLAERLRQELKEAGGAQGGASAPDAAREDALAKLVRSVRQLSTQQRKLSHGVEKLPRTTRPATVAPETFDPMIEGLKAVQKELAALRRERKKEDKQLAEQLDKVRSEVRSCKSAIQKRTGAAAVRRKGDPERVGVFVDVQNMYYGARQLKGKLDFDALLQAAVRDRRRIQAKAYVVESKEIDQSGFISRLQQRAIEVLRKTLTVRSDGSMKGDWDMEMALDILDAAPQLDVIVLVSGDGDFTSLVRRLQRMGPRVEVIGWPRTTAKSLIEAADRFQPLDRKFMIRSEGNGKKKKEPAPADTAGKRR